VLLRTDHYLIKEISLTFCATILILLTTVLSFRLASYFNQAASGLLAQDVIWLMIGLQAIRFLVVLTPPALLLSVVLTLGRLYQDNEMVALSACGGGPSIIYRPLFLLLLPMALILTGLSFYLVPLCMELHLELQFQARQNAQISIITPGTFRELSNGKYVIYVGNVSHNGRELRNIFIRGNDGDQVAVITSQRGHQKIDPQSGVRYVVLEDGYRYQGAPGSGKAGTLRFQRLIFQIDNEPIHQTETKREAIPTAQLINSPSPLHRAELHERLASPLSLLVLGFLSPLLAHTQPREGRYGRVVAAILLYTIYSNLLEVGYAWLADGTLWQPLGLWWVHSLPILLGFGLWWYRYGNSLSRGCEKSSWLQAIYFNRSPPLATDKG
jgi:lipopolysaccharide export system permease protein